MLLSNSDLLEVPTRRIALKKIMILSLDLIEKFQAQVSYLAWSGAGGKSVYSDFYTWLKLHVNNL